MDFIDANITETNMLNDDEFYSETKVKPAK